MEKSIEERLTDIETQANLVISRGFDAQRNAKEVLNQVKAIRQQLAAKA